jgi:8-oxo-dGTP pyrophosphatase MutT (NUDIX family)
MTGETAHHSVSVAGVVIDENGRTLVIQRRDNGRWEPPGGVLERDESIVEGLLREVREETGLVVEPIALTGVYKNMRLGVLALVFRCRPGSAGYRNLR